MLFPCGALTWVSWEQDQCPGGCSSKVCSVGSWKSHLFGLFLRDLTSFGGVPHRAGAGAFVTSCGGALGLGSQELWIFAGCRGILSWTWVQGVASLPPLTPATLHSQDQAAVI